MFPALPRTARLLPLALLAALLLACTREAPRPVAASPTASPTAAPSPPPPIESPAPFAPLVLPAVPTPSPVPKPPVLSTAIRGWFIDRRPPPTAARRAIEAPPASSFPARPKDTRDVVVYDVEAGTQEAVGEGREAKFSPDGTRLLWLGGSAQDRLMVWSFAAREARDLGAASEAIWLDDLTVLVDFYGLRPQAVDVQSGTRRPGGETRASSYVARPFEAGGIRLERDYSRPGIIVSRVTEIGTGVTFDPGRVHAVTLAPDGMLVVATPLYATTPPAPENNFRLTGTTNIFIVDPRSREATFIATTPATEATGFELSADKDTILWRNTCSPDPWHLFDRQTGALTDLVMPKEFNLAGLTGTGRLWAYRWDGFGAKVLIDVATLRYVAVLPEGLGDVGWAGDFRFAVASVTGGHGGLCG